MKTISQRRPARRTGFTLVEVLIAMLFMVIVLPVLLKGIAICDMAASRSRARDAAAGMAQSKLSEILAAQAWKTGNLSGDFAPIDSTMHWQTTVTSWAGDTTGAGIQQVDLVVTFPENGRQQPLKISTLAYPLPMQSGQKS